MVNFSNEGKPVVVLIDFNISRKFQDPDTSNIFVMLTNTGTAKYQAPEQLSSHDSYGYSCQIDNWSAGAVLYFLLTGGIHAFNFSDQLVIENKILEADFDKSIAEYCCLSEDAKCLIKGLMTVSVPDRMTAQQALNHRWL